MVKHTEAIRPEFADGNFLTNCLSVFDHFVGLALKGLMKTQTVMFKLLTLNKVKVLFKYLYH